MRKVLLYASATGLSLLGAIALYAEHSNVVGMAQARTAISFIEVAEGHFDKNNYYELLKFIGKKQDRIIGLKVSIEKAHENDAYLTSIEGRQLIISSLGVSSGIEALIADGRYEHGSYVLDGFYLVKSGGMHQGTLSYGLTNVDETQIRLNNNLKIRSVKIGR